MNETDRKERHTERRLGLWPKKEKSTRNCYNCLSDGIAVWCRERYPLYIVGEGCIVFLPLLIAEEDSGFFQCCKNCTDFEAGW